MVLAVDFDGTICEQCFPNIGLPIYPMIDWLKEMQALGHRLILWTCRRDERLAEAVSWCEKHNLFFDAINKNLEENILLYGGDTRKVCADYYIDDKNITLESILKGETPWTERF